MPDISPTLSAIIFAFAVATLFVCLAAFVSAERSAMRQQTRVRHRSVQPVDRDTP